jgi:hypothetical protein
MNPEIATQYAQLCERMRKIAWFSSVGESTQLTLPFPHRFVRDVEAAKADIAQPQWAEWTLERGNATTSFLHAQFRSRYAGQWNKIVVIAKSFLQHELEPKFLPELARTLPGSKAAIDSVRWDLISALMESAYADCNPPVFFTDLIPVYEAGHLPVGWDQTTGSGTLLVH